MSEPDVLLCHEEFPSDVGHISGVTCQLDRDHDAGELHYGQYPGGWVRWSGTTTSDEDPRRRSPDEIHDALVNTSWYAVRNDTIGGWAVANVDRSVATHDMRRGDVVVGDMLDEWFARYIVRLHNNELRLRETRRMQGP
jgi:hypothetical protein